MLNLFVLGYFVDSLGISTEMIMLSVEKAEFSFQSGGLLFFLTDWIG